jgi:hypothetical protein
MATKTELSCACGAFALELTGAPFITAECHCNSCREAGKRLDALPLARKMLASNDGTPFVLYRKDRVRLLKGQEHLAEFRLNAETPTRRVVTTCCRTPVFLEFKGGHWLSLYSALWPEGTAPAPSIRTMVSDRPAGNSLPDDLPSGPLVTAGFYARLLGAWIAMGFKSPEVTIPQTIEA